MEKVKEFEFCRFRKIILTKQEIIEIVSIILDRPLDRSIDLQLNGTKYTDDERAIFLQTISESRLITTLKINSHYYETRISNLYLNIYLVLDENEVRLSTDDQNSEEYLKIKDKVNAILSKAEVEEERERYFKSHEISKIDIDLLDRILSVLSKSGGTVAVEINNKKITLDNRKANSFRDFNVGKPRKISEIKISCFLNRRILQDGFEFNSEQDSISVEFDPRSVYIRACDKNKPEIKGMIDDINRILFRKVPVIDRLGNPLIGFPIAIVWAFLLAIGSGVIFDIRGPTVSLIFYTVLIIMVIFFSFRWFASAKKPSIAIIDSESGELGFIGNHRGEISYIVQLLVGAIVAWLIPFLMNKFVFPPT